MEKNKESEIVEYMIRQYCLGKHNSRKMEICSDCQNLLAYTKLRIEKCPYQENKPFCSNCKTQCYNREEKEKIREVMRYSAPRITLRHPIISLRHVTETLKERRKTEKSTKVK